MNFQIWTLGFSFRNHLFISTLSFSNQNFDHNDQLFLVKYRCPTFLCVLMLDFLSHRVHQQKMTDSAAPKKYNKARPIGSCNTSVASSECSDEPFIDFDGEDSLFGMTDDNDYLNNSILNMLGGSEPGL